MFSLVSADPALPLWSERIIDLQKPRADVDVIMATLYHSAMSVRWLIVLTLSAGCSSVTFVTSTAYTSSPMVQRGAWKTRVKVDFCPMFYNSSPPGERRAELRKLQKRMRSLEVKMLRGEFPVDKFINTGRALSWGLAFMANVYCQSGVPLNSEIDLAEFESIAKSKGNDALLKEFVQRLGATVTTGAPFANPVAVPAEPSTPESTSTGPAAPAEPPPPAAETSSARSDKP